MKLDKMEELLNEEQLFFKWLKEKRVNFIDLAELYTLYLEKEKEAKELKCSRYSNLLAMHLDFEKLAPKNIWVRDKTIAMLSAYEDFKTAPIYKKWQEEIKEKQLNTNLETLDYMIYNDTKGI